MDQIKKRDGSLVPFDSTKIRNAIMKANVRVADEPMTDDDLDFLAQRVVKKLEKENAVPDVEHVQDIVERTLSKAGYSRTAKAYILYRAEHAKMREMRDTLPDIFSNLTFAAAKDVDMKRENANINTDTAMGTMLKFGTESAKDYFDKYIIPSHIAQADKDGDIHIHDKDFYTLTETCCQIDLLKLFKGGFSTGHGYLREPNSIRSYAALACIAIQSNQNEMHGGQAVPNFDYAMAEGVRKTYRKAILKHTAEVLENRNVWPVGKGYEELKKIVNERNIPVPTMGQKDDNTWPSGFNDKIHEALDTWGLLFTEHYKPIAQRAYADTVDETHQAMEAVIHNLNSMHCLLPSEKVWVEYRDENGVNTVTTMTILELYRLVNDVTDHHTWLKVYSVNPATGKIEMKPVYAARRMDKDREMVTLTSKSGNNVTCTTNHKIIQLVDGKLTEVLPKDATHLVINRNVVNASTITPDKVKKAYDALGNRYDDLVVSDIVDREYFNSGDEYVYDISVVDNENFMLADGTFVHNSRAGAQVPFSSINYGTDTSPEGQLVIKEILQATEEGLGNGETPIFPVQIFKVKEGTNYNPGDPNYNLFKQAMKVSAKRLFPNFSFMDAPFNAQYLGRHPDKPYYDEVGYMGCVHANTIVTYKENNQAHVTSIENAWNTLSQRYPVLTHGGSEFIDLANADVTIYDTKAKDYVKVKKWIKNPAPKEWRKIICGETFVVVTPDHPLMACLGHEDDPNAHDLAERRVRAENLKAGVDSLYKVKNGHIVKTKITAIVTVPSKDGEYSYDVETASDRFDANFFVSHNCRTRVMGNVYDPENEVTPGRGNLSFTSINLPRIAIQARNLTDDDGNFNAPTDMAKFYRILDERIDLCIEQLLHRFKIQCSKHAYNYPFLMGEGVWINSEKLAPMDTVGEVLKHGTLSVGFIGLAETLVALTGKHHGESEESWKLGYEIIKHMRDKLDKKSEELRLNLSLLATPAEGLCLSGDTSVQTIDGCKPIKDIKIGDPVVTLNENTGRFEIDTVIASGQTGIRDDIYEIEFTNGQKIVCTSNHPFAKRQWGYDNNVPTEQIAWTQAQNLKPGDRIRSGYRTKSDGGYLRYQHGPNGADYMHKMAYEYFTGQKVPEGMIVHHKDENKQNNSDPTNLELMTGKAHKIYHMKDTIGQHCYTTGDQLGEKNSFFGKHHSEETKQQICNTKGFNYVSAEQLVQEYTETNATATELATKHNMHISTVCKKLRLQGIKPDPWKNRPRKGPSPEELAKEYYAGANSKILSDKYGICQSEVCKRLKSVGVVLQRNHTVKTVRKLDVSIPVYDITMSKNHNFLVGGEEGILVHNSGTFVRIDKKKFGVIPGVTDRDYYTNSFHVPVYYPISAFEKIKKEAPFHELTNAGHISYVEVDGDIAKNIDAFEAIIRCMKESGIGYGSVNHPVDRDPICGYVGIINETCPRCGRHEGEAVPLSKLEELQTKYRNMPDITKYIE